MGFPKQEYWSGLPFPFPEDLPDPGIEPGLPRCMQMLTVWATRKALTTPKGPTSRAHHAGEEGFNTGI